MIVKFIITLAVSFLSGITARKVKLPAPLLVGGILGTAVYTVLSGQGVCLPSVRFWLQIISGTYIGSTISRSDIAGVKQLILPTLFIVSAMLVTNLFLGTVIHTVFQKDLLTSLLGTIPGGVTETTIIADQMGADVSVVAVMQIMRSVCSIALFPFIIKKILNDKKAPVQVSDGIDFMQHVTQIQNKKKVFSINHSLPALGRICISFAIGTMGGCLGSHFPGIPAGALVGSMILAATGNITIFSSYIPLKMKRFAQILTGVYIGTKITRDVAASLTGLFFPVCIMIAGLLFFHTVIALLAAKLFKTRKSVMLFSCIPAGASDIALVASELGCDSPQIAIYQLIRLISCILVFPTILKLYTLLF